MLPLWDSNMEKILWIQYQANSMRIDGYDTFQEIIGLNIIGTIFGSFTPHNDKK